MNKQKTFNFTQPKLLIRATPEYQELGWLAHLLGIWPWSNLMQVTATLRPVSSLTKLEVCPRWIPGMLSDLLVIGCFYFCFEFCQAKFLLQRQYRSPLFIFFFFGTSCAGLLHIRSPARQNPPLWVQREFRSCSPSHPMQPTQIMRSWCPVEAW